MLRGYHFAISEHLRQMSTNLENRWSRSDFSNSAIEQPESYERFINSFVDRSEALVEELQLVSSRLNQAVSSAKKNQDG